MNMRQTTQRGQHLGSWVRRATAIVTIVALTLSIHARANEVINPFDKNSGANTYQGGFADFNWVGSSYGIAPLAGTEYFNSANGNAAIDFNGIGFTKVLGGAIEDKSYDVSFFITKYDDNGMTLNGVDFASFSTLRIGGVGGTMTWTSTPTPAQNGVWVEWVGRYTPSATDLGAPFQFIVVMSLKRMTSLGIDEPEAASIENPVPTSAQQCKELGWHAYGFVNQGQCVQFVNTGK